MRNGLPFGWEESTIDEIAEINPRHNRELDNNLLVTFVPMDALSEEKWSFEYAEERPLGEVRKNHTHFADGDVLFAKITPCMENGKAAVAVDLRNGLGCATTEVHVVRPLGGIEPKFIYRYVRDISALPTYRMGELTGKWFLFVKSLTKE